MVYVLNKDGQSLMPTNRYAKVRILLKNKLAKVVQAKPFTIQLLYETSDFTQPLTLGVDSGYLNIGFVYCIRNLITWFCHKTFHLLFKYFNQSIA